MGMNGIKAFSIVALVLASMATPLSARAAGDRVVVFAAASLKNAMDDVAAAYERVHDADLRVSYAGSSTLARQIEQGAPAAVYVSANEAWMDRLENKGRIAAASRIDLLRNELVLVAPVSSDVRATLDASADLRSLLGEGGYLAMANTDAVPAGIYGRQALRHLGLWDGLQGRIAQAEDVRAALALVARGETPLGIVYSSDAVAQADVRVVDTFASDSHDAIVYPAAITADADTPAARDFLAFLQGEQARTLFRKWGFGVADGE